MWMACQQCQQGHQPYSQQALTQQQRRAPSVRQPLAVGAAPIVSIATLLFLRHGDAVNLLAHRCVRVPPATSRPPPVNLQRSRLLAALGGPAGFSTCKARAPWAHLPTQQQRVPLSSSNSREQQGAARRLVREYQPPLHRIAAGLV
jgi:hypothetical protein